MRGPRAADGAELSVGIAGLGYWGPNLLRNFRSVDGCRVTAMADIHPARLAEVSRLNPDVRCLGSAEELVDDRAVDAVVLALPAGMLPGLALRALERGKHVLVEKPMAHSLELGLSMQRLADQAELVAMVDFTFVYSPAVRHLRTLIAGGTLGSPHYYQSTRINLGRFQPDVDVVWDLVVHDVAILCHVLERDPVAVMAVGRGRDGEAVDTSHVTLTYDDGLQAFIQVSWLAPMKVRTAVLSCERGMVVYNDVEPDEKIRVYQLQQEFDPGTEDPIAPTFRLGDVTIPRLPQEEPLRAVAATFVRAAQGGPPPPTDFSFGTRVLAVLEAARSSLRSGEVVPVPIPVRHP